MWLVPIWIVAMYSLYEAAICWWRSAPWFSNLSSNYKRENVAYRVNMLVFTVGIYVYVGWVILTQPGWSFWEIWDHFRNPTEEGAFACYPDLSPLFQIFLGNSIYEEIMSIKMNASWIYHIHALLSILLSGGVLVSPLESTATLLLLEITGIPLAIATIADAMGKTRVATMAGIAFALLWLVFRLCLFTPYVIFYLWGTHKTLAKNSSALSELNSMHLEVSKWSLLVICFMNWYWGFGIYRKISREFKTTSGYISVPKVNRMRWYHQILRVMDDLNNLYLCPMWIQLDEYKAKVVKSVDECKQKMEEYKAELAKSVDGYTSNLAKSVDVYKAKVSQSIDDYTTKVREYKNKMGKDLAKSVDEVASNFHEKVDGVKKVVSSTVDHIQTMKLKMQELHSVRSSGHDFGNT